jgi:hypothetical protein
LSPHPIIKILSKGAYSGSDEEIRKEQYDNFTFVPMLGGIKE